MTSKKIYLIRHGETEYNLKRMVQGSGVNSSLNETGKNQAQAFYEHYRHLKFDNIYTSALLRTIETVQPFLNDGYEHEPLEWLNEISWGNKEGLAVNEEEHSHYNQVIKAWQNGDLKQKMMDGESPQEVAVRLSKALDYILKKEDEQLVLICMHGRAMRILLCLLLNYPIKCMDFFPHNNTCLYKIEHTGILSRISLFNDQRHLELLKK